MYQYVAFISFSQAIAFFIYDFAAKSITSHSASY